MTVFENINRLVSYGLKTGLIGSDDIIFTQNMLLMNLGLDGFESAEQASSIPDVKIEDLNLMKPLLYILGLNLVKDYMYIAIMKYMIAMGI